MKHDPDTPPPTEDELALIEEELFLESGTALLSEQALAEDWNRPGEDEAWSHLQRVQ